MNTKKVRVGATKMIAHRGCSCLERENTLAAFIAAGNRSYYGIETDVHRTADGGYVLIHDSNTGRVGTDMLDVERSDFAAVRRTLLRDIDDTAHRIDLHIPTLAEYVGTCRRYEKAGVLEIKGSFTVGQMDEVMAVIGDYAHRMIIISFFYDSLLNLRVHHPEQTAQLLCGKIDNAMLDKLAENRFGLDIHYASMTEELLRACRERHIVTNVWTVDNPADCERLAAMGVDFITSDCCEAE